MTPEGRVVARLKKTCKELGLPFVRMSLRPGVAVGWPDFIILGPGGRTLWVETKAPGKDAKPIQKERARIITSMGCAWAKPDTPQKAEECVVSFSRWSPDQRKNKPDA